MFPVVFRSQIINHKSEGLCLGAEESLYLGAVLHESCRNSVRGRTPKGAQLLVPEGIKNYPRAGCFAFSTVAQTWSQTVVRRVGCAHHSAKKRSGHTSSKSICQNEICPRPVPLPCHSRAGRNHRSRGLRFGAEESLYLGAVLHESCRNSVRAARPKSA